MFIINVREIIVNNLIQLKMSGKYDFELKFDKSGNLSFSIYWKKRRKMTPKS